MTICCGEIIAGAKKAIVYRLFTSPATHLPLAYSLPISFK